MEEDNYFTYNTGSVPLGSGYSNLEAGFERNNIENVQILDDLSDDNEH